MASTFITLPAAADIVGPVEVTVNAQNDSIRIADAAGDTLAINSDGSINVSGIENITGTVSIDGGTVAISGQNEFEYNELIIPAAGNATVVSRFFAVAYKLRRVSATGGTIGTYTVRFNGTAVDKLRSNYTDFNCRFDYETGISIPPGTTVTVFVENGSTVDAALFSAQLLFSAT